MTTKNTGPEFSHVVQVEKIPATGIVKKLEANPEERKLLARRFDILDLPKLVAELTVMPARAGQALSVKGHMTADVVQKCVVTLDPLPGHIERDIEMFYENVEPQAGELAPIEPNELEVEPLTDGFVDLGELLAQNLGIALDPYPRKAGVAVPEVFAGEASNPSNPMAKLIELKSKLNVRSKE
ncbi:MAG: DUF177 domain-containing protein [Pseudomonadota bacterium]|nr:DUF177 domain-containing protein [Pseudomonadota bacterium]